MSCVMINTFSFHVYVCVCVCVCVCMCVCVCVGRKKDHACSDRKFAGNVGLQFLTPEEYFFDYPVCRQFSWGEFVPRSLDFGATGPSLDPPDAKLTSEETEVIVFVGCPASGKSTFFARHLKPAGYFLVSRDQLGSWQRCVAECRKALLAGRRVVVDNTSPDVESRGRYVECAKEARVPARCFWFTTSSKLAVHNNLFRELTVQDSGYKTVSHLAFRSYSSKFQEPSIDEGFTEIVRVDFMPTFANDRLKALYMMYLL